MASLIRLKQIESGSALTTAAATGADFSQSVINIVASEVVGILPDGVVSSSVQVILQETSGLLSGSKVVGDIAATSVNYEDIIGLPTLVSGSLQVVGILDSLNQFSSSINQFSSSLDSGFATDAELAVTTSNLNIDMGEF
jgi:hypothetical protein